MTKEKNLKDYLHLYLGCHCVVDGRPAIIDSVSTNKHIDTVTAQFTDTNDQYDWAVYNDLSEVKLLLRPLSDMTEQEFKEIFKPIQPGDVTDEDFKEAMQHLIKNGIDAFDFEGVSAQIVFEYTRLLLSKGFDIFELIPSGLAIDKTTLQTQMDNG
jgi:hypothetical protein